LHPEASFFPSGDHAIAKIQFLCPEENRKIHFSIENPKKISLIKPGPLRTIDQLITSID
jgi:hypothetical protein